MGAAVAVGGPDFAGTNATIRLCAAAGRWVAIEEVRTGGRRAVVTAFAIDGQLDGVALATRLQEVIGALAASTVIELLESAGVPACTAIERVELDDPFLVENDYSHVFETTGTGRAEAGRGCGQWWLLGGLPWRPPSACLVLRVRRWRSGLSHGGLAVVRGAAETEDGDANLAKEHYWSKAAASPATSSASSATPST